MAPQCSTSIRYLTGLLSSLFTVASFAAPTSHDIVVYGGTSGGVAAAVQAARMGRTVVLIEPTRRLGGLTTGGLGQTDIGNKQAIGGISREFYQRIRQHYNRPEAWKWQPHETYRSEGQSRTGDQEDTMWTFEPSAALRVFQDLVREHHVPVIYGERLDLGNGVVKDGARIVRIRMESGREFEGTVFIDATYEGDLMAGAGVSYTVGREANSQYGETLNGVQTRYAKHHQLVAGLDPFVRKGDPSSGLLPGVDPNGPGEEGSRDHRVQAYCFRMCLTDHPDNRLPWTKPDSYRELDYELLFRNFEAGFDGVPWNNSAMPNRKTDVNNNTGFSTDFIGQNYDYPDADYETRARIVQRHLEYQRGLMWTLAHHPRVPEHVRREVSKWGPCKDEFVEGGGWQEQLYIREARRMVGAYVMTQHHCQGRAVAEDSVGLAAYTMDSHNVQRHVDAQGHVRNEGDVQVGGFPPYPISYRSLVPKADECENLLVPVCLSATHMAFGSIRMEPVFMVLGQSAATAAVLALDAETPVLQVDYANLRERLLADRQVLKHEGPPVQPARPGIEAATLDGLVVDSDDAAAPVIRRGFETFSSSTWPHVGVGYWHDGDTDKGSQAVRFTIDVPEAGRYDVRLAYPAHGNRATNVPVMIHATDGVKKVLVNQRQRAESEGLFQSLGIFNFDAGPGRIEISNTGTDGYVIADAIQLLPVK